MAASLYAVLHPEPSTVDVLVSSIGQQPIFGPGLVGDGWTEVARLPASRIPNGSDHLAFIVSGRIGDTNYSLSNQQGFFEVALGLSSGVKNPAQVMRLDVNERLGQFEGAGFQFMMFVDAATPDPFWGSSWPPNPGDELVLYARVLQWPTTGTAWTASFRVAGVGFLVFDLDEIPVGDRIVTQVYHPQGQLQTVGAQIAAGSSHGAAGQKWAHWSSVEWRQMHPPTANPCLWRWTCGATTKIGDPAAAPYGWSRRYTHPLVGPLHHDGPFFVHEYTGSHAVACNVTPTGAPGVGENPLLLAYRHFAVRVDTLPEVSMRYEASVNELFVNWLDPLLPLYGINSERPQPLAPWSNSVIVVAHATVPGTTNVGGNLQIDGEPWVQALRSGQQMLRSLLFPTFDRNNVGSLCTIGTLPWQLSDRGADTYRTTVRSTNRQVGLQPGSVRDFSFLAFHPVRDPDDLPTPQNVIPAPVYLVPARQSLAAGALPAPPTAPNGDHLERHQAEWANIAAKYRRRWPVGSRPVRMWTLTWGPLDEAAAAAVFAFLRANRTWRFTPHRQDPIAVMSSSAPELAPASHRTATVQVDVVELLWTGA